MGVRRALAETLREAIGPDRLDRLRGTEVRTRRRLAQALDPEAPRPVDAPAASARVGGRGPSKGARRHQGTSRGRRRTGRDGAAGTRGLTREERIDALGRQSLEGVVHQETDRGWVTSDPFADFPEATANRYDVLAGLHRVLEPRTYLEIGIRKGHSLHLSRCRTIGVDPAYRITRPLHCDLQTFLETSDEFFRRPKGLAHFGGVPVDLAFIDGMHLADFVLRDFINVEKHMARTGVVVIDDVLPRNDLEAYRIRRTGAWSGDVYKVLDVLGEHRPDLTVIPLNTLPTGTVLVLGLDPTSRVLEAAYPSIEQSLVVPDPQQVADRWKRRTTARDPREVLELEVWKDLVALRGTEATRADLEPVWRRLSEVRPVVGRGVTGPGTE